MFTVPEYAKAAFLKLADNDAEVSEKVWTWTQYAFGMSSPVYIETGKEMLDVPARALLAGFEVACPIIDAQQWRMEMLAEMFNKGLELRTGLTTRLVVEPYRDKYVINTHSIGRYREWCWIDQKDAIEFPQDRPYDVMVELARRAADDRYTG